MTDSRYAVPLVAVTSDGTPIPGGSGSGTVTSVTAADGTISVGGSATAPTVAVGAVPESQVTTLVSDLASKAADSAVVHKAGAETIAGVKTFTAAPVLPAASVADASLSANVALLAGAQTIAGVKTFSSAPVVPSASFPESAVTNLVTDLAAKVTAVTAADSTVTLAGTATVPTVAVNTTNIATTSYAANRAVSINVALHTV